MSGEINLVYIFVHCVKEQFIGRIVTGSSFK